MICHDPADLTDLWVVKREIFNATYVVSDKQTKMLMEINYVTGDATVPQGEGVKIIAHVCNDIGGWGRGFVLAVSKRWPQPERDYRDWHRQKYWSQDDESIPFSLGKVQLVKITSDTHVANMIGQHGTTWKNGVPPVRYGAIREALRTLSTKAIRLNASVHMPRIGAGLAGGEWKEIERIIAEELCSKLNSVSVYDLPK
jgi:O-acetyl-ADP-ribose deacetylase (regulator of RNase III)